MRNPERIDIFCKQFSEIWHQVPDLRFGQLIMNVFSKLPQSPFYLEDDEMIKFITENINKMLNKGE